MTGTHFPTCGLTPTSEVGYCFYGPTSLGAAVAPAVRSVQLSSFTLHVVSLT